MKKKIKTLLVIVGIIVGLLVGIYYYGFVSAFKNYGEMGNGYPLATYSFQSDPRRTKQLLDSLSRVYQFALRYNTTPGDSLYNQISVAINSKTDSLIFDIEFKSSRSLQDSMTELYLVRVADRTRSVFYQTARSSDEAFVYKLKTILESKLIDKIKKNR